MFLRCNVMVTFLLSLVWLLVHVAAKDFMVNLGQVVPKTVSSTGVEASNPCDMHGMVRRWRYS